MAFEFNFKGDFASRRDLHRCRVRAAFNFKIKGSFAAGFAGFSELLLGAPRSNQEALHGDAAGPAARFPAFLAANGRFRTRSLWSLRHAEPEYPVHSCDTRRRRRRGCGLITCGGHLRHAPNFRWPPICLDGAEKRRARRKKRRRMSERPKGASSARPAWTEHRREPGAVCRAPSRHERFCLLLPHQK